MASASPSDEHADDAANVSMPPHLNEKNVNHIPAILPRERVFPIQIGRRLFKLSGASLSSDAPSYFSQYFLCQLKQEPGQGIRTLYIDRDPETFGDIALHLQGYRVVPRDGKHFVRLFADAQFYSLPKLISQLYEESIFISIGHREFQIPRDLLTDPRNSPNFFSLGFAFFFSGPDNLFPGLDREGLIRPPSILPPSVPNRDADTFADLLRLLRGYPVHIRDETHRADLLRDARYFHFKGLEQELLPHSLAYDPVWGRDEITLRLENVQKSGISISSPSPSSSPPSSSSGGHDQAQQQPPPPCLISYARPYVDTKPADLIVEIAHSSSIIHFFPDGPRVEFFRDTRARVARLLEVVATKLCLPPTTLPLGLLMASGGASSQPATPGNTPLSEDLVRVSLGPEAAVFLDGREHALDALPGQHVPNGTDGGGRDANGSQPRKRRRTDGGLVADSWTVRTGQWRLRIQSSSTVNAKSAVECVFVAVRLDAVSSEHGRNLARPFLMT